MRRQFTALALAGVFALGLTACSAPSHLGDGPDFGTSKKQTVAEACASFTTAMTEGQSQLGAALRDAGNDPEKTAAAFQLLEDSLSDAFAPITNAQVSELGTTILGDLSAMADVANDVIGNGNVARTTELNDASNAFTLSMQELQALCA